LYSLSACDCVELKFQKANEMLTNCHSLRIRLEDSICWIGDFKPIVTKCFPFEEMNHQFGGGAEPNVETPGSVCFIRSWLHFIFWWLNAVPQVYRASFFTNLSSYMVKLSACLNKPFYTKMLANGAANDASTKLSQGLILSNMSREVMACVAKPSITSCYVPCSFIDFTSSFQHPTTYDAFKNIIPDYVQMGVLPLSSPEDPTDPATECVRLLRAELLGDADCLTSFLGPHILGV
jgi:hypothetical protein